MGIGGPDRTAFEWQGNWQAFLPIALTNGLLTIVTLGIYRFWATTRERQYFWANTRFIDDQLEWTGKGLELFFGAIIAFFVLLVPIVGIQFLAQYLVLNGMPVVAGILGLITYLLLFWLIGFAIFRGLRYRLSRTSWHGIHGGSDEPGTGFATSYLWKTIVGFIPLGLLIPWASTKLFKERWESMSFGPHNFVANPNWLNLMKRFGLFYVLPVLAAILGGGALWKGGDDVGSVGAGAAAAGLLVLFFYIALPIISLVYFAAYARETVGSVKLASLEFDFTARSSDWLMLALGNLAIWFAAVIVGLIGAFVFGGFGALMSQGGEVDPVMAMITAGSSGFLIILSFLIPLMLVGPFLRYRNWAFFIRHMEAGGEVNLADLTQSETAALRQGEGLLDAFDMGAV
jgi:uncharacterized membrane protein YjgN (DUF898 family)